MSTLHVALIQCRVGKTKRDNLEKAKKLIVEAAKSGAQLIALPECFNSPYGLEFFGDYAEPIPDGPTSEMLSRAAKENEIFLVGGTFPEIKNGKYYNTCTVWNPEGKLIVKYRKVHLFDMDCPEKVIFKESSVMSPGNKLATFTVGSTKVGLGICHDIRFDEIAKLYALQGVSILLYPAAFEIVTGQKYFELIQRCRALDNQCFVLAVSPARGDDGYIAWGHSQITDPWAEVVAQAKEGEEIVQAVLDLTECDKVRRQAPILNQRRTDLYDTVLLEPNGK